MNANTITGSPATRALYRHQCGCYVKKGQGIIYCRMHREAQWMCDLLCALRLSAGEGSGLAQMIDERLPLIMEAINGTTR